MGRWRWAYNNVCTAAIDKGFFSDGIEEGVRISGGEGLKDEGATVTGINSMVMEGLEGGLER